MFICGVDLVNCTGSNLNGSFAHISCNQDSTVTQILYNEIISTNEIGDSIMEHSEGAITFSAKVQNLLMAYNNIDSISEAGLAPVNGDDFNLEVTDNLLNTRKGVLVFTPFYNKDSTNLIYNNKNLFFSQSTSANCLASEPTILSDCNNLSGIDNTLEIGDVLTVTIGGLNFLSTNENFVKCINPVIDSNFFKLKSIAVKTDVLSARHQWVPSPNLELCSGIVF